jgi:hypothetical protein
MEKQKGGIIDAALLGRSCRSVPASLGRIAQAGPLSPLRLPRSFRCGLRFSEKCVLPLLAAKFFARDAHLLQGLVVHAEKGARNIALRLPLTSSDEVPICVAEK